MDPSILTQGGCDVDALAKLVNQGMDLTQCCSPQNRTVLHYWAAGHYFYTIPTDDITSHQEDALAVVKILVEKGADLLALNSLGLTPLLVAAIGRYRDDRLNLKVLDFLLEREEYSQAEKIEAMELAGAVILKNTKDDSQFQKAFDYWRTTLHLRRQIEVEDSDFIEKARLNLKNIQTTEWNTSAELEEVIKHLVQFLIQSFLVQLRILSSKNLGHIRYLFWNDLMDTCFRQLRHQRKFYNIFDILWAMLETLLSRSDGNENKETHLITTRVVEELICVFTYLKRDSSEILTENIITSSLDLIISIIEINRFGLLDLNRFLIIISHPPQSPLNKDTIENLSKVRDQNGRNLLHQSVLRALSDVDNYATVRLLLNAGCDPNHAIDQDGNTPLHFLAKVDQGYWFDDDRRNTIAVLLLDFGAQLSLKNVDGKTASDLLIQKNSRNRNTDAEDQGIIGWKVPDWCSELPTLTTLSARVIRRNRIPYLELPATLIPMIEKHKL